MTNDSANLPFGGSKTVDPATGLDDADLDFWEPEDEANPEPGRASEYGRDETRGEGHDDPATRERAERRARSWMDVLRGLWEGVLAIGSRTPVAGTPPWATLQVLRGGFASGALLAEGALLPHERELLDARTWPEDTRRFLGWTTGKHWLLAA